jgi:hypothetical protein
MAGAVFVVDDAVDGTWDSAVELLVLMSPASPDMPTEWLNDI